MFKRRPAQIISEYAVMISVVVLVVVTMFTLVKRSTQKLTQLAADRIGNQINSDQDFASNRGYMISSSTHTDSQIIRTSWHIPGAKGIGYDDSVNASTNTYSNQGFTSDQEDVVTNSAMDQLPNVTLP